jgi:hypothetical protein
MAYTDIDKPEDYFNTKLYTGNNTTECNYWCWISTRFSLG